MTLTGRPPLEALYDSIEQNTTLKKGGTEVKVSLHQAILRLGAPGRFVADLLHGTWLGHPLHPVLTDVTIGAWLSSVALDLIGQATGRRNMEEAADALLGLGTASAVPTALAGLTDYSAIKQDAVEYGATHGILNSLALGCFLLSIRARRAGNRESGVGLSLIGLGLSMASAWLGGEMINHRRVGVNHAPMPVHPEVWTPVAALHDLTPGEPVRVAVDGDPIVLYRRGEQVYAIGAVCPHAGGPLEQGSFDGHCVTCPWHDSVFDLRDGALVHGPSTFPVPAYETRVNANMVELRVATR